MKNGFQNLHVSMDYTSDTKNAPDFSIQEQQKNQSQQQQQQQQPQPVPVKILDNHEVFRVAVKNNKNKIKPDIIDLLSDDDDDVDDENDESFQKNVSKAISNKTRADDNHVQKHENHKSTLTNANHESKRKNNNNNLVRAAKEHFIKENDDTWTKVFDKLQSHNMIHSIQRPTTSPTGPYLYILGDKKGPSDGGKVGVDYFDSRDAVKEWITKEFLTGIKTSNGKNNHEESKSSGSTSSVCPHEKRRRPQELENIQNEPENKRPNKNESSFLSVSETSSVRKQCASTLSHKEKQHSTKKVQEEEIRKSDKKPSNNTSMENESLISPSSTHQINRKERDTTKSRDKSTTLTSHGTNGNQYRRRLKFTFKTSERIGLAIEAQRVTEIVEGSQAHKLKVPIRTRILSLNGQPFEEGDDVKRRYEIAIQSKDTIELEFGVPYEPGSPAFINNNNKSSTDEHLEKLQRSNKKEKGRENNTTNGPNLKSPKRKMKEQNGMKKKLVKNNPNAPSRSSSFNGSSDYSSEVEIRGQKPRQQPNPNTVAVSSSLSRRQDVSNSEHSSFEHRISSTSSMSKSTDCLDRELSNKSPNGEETGSSLLCKEVLRDSPLYKNNHRNAPDNSKDVGSRVYACWTNGEYYWGVVTQIRRGQQPGGKKNYSVKFDDGDELHDLPPSRVWSVASYRMIFDKDPPPLPTLTQNVPVEKSTISKNQSLSITTLPTEKRTTPTKTPPKSKTQCNSAEKSPPIYVQDDAYSPHELFIKRCKKCALCLKDDCKLCDSCFQSQYAPLTEKRVCLRKMCCAISVEKKAQPARGFSLGWKFFFDRASDDPSLLKNQIPCPGLEGLTMISPQGSHHHAAELSSKSFQTKFDDLQNVEKILRDFYHFLGFYEGDRTLKKRITRAPSKCDEAASKENPKAHTQEKKIAEASMSLEDLYEKRCGECVLCKMDECQKCKSCRTNQSLGIKSKKLACIQQICCRFEEKYKAQSAIGLPTGWKFYFRKPGNGKKVSLLDRITLITPKGRVYRSLESARIADSLSLDLFYKQIGFEKKRRNGSQPKTKPLPGEKNVSMSEGGSDCNEAEIGCRVYARWTNGSWYWGRITNRFKRKGGYHYSVRFDDGDFLEDVAPHHLATEAQHAASAPKVEQDFSKDVVDIQGIYGNIHFDQNTKLFRTYIKYGNRFWLIGNYTTDVFATWIREGVKTLLASDGKTHTERHLISDELAEAAVNNARDTFLQSSVHLDGINKWLNFDKNCNSWRLSILYGPKSWTLGCFETKETCHRVLEAARELLSIEGKTMEECSKLKKEEASVIIKKVKNNVSLLLKRKHNKGEFRGQGAISLTEPFNINTSNTFNDTNPEEKMCERSLRRRAIDMFAEGSFPSLSNFVNCFNKKTGKQKGNPEYLTYGKFWKWWDAERYSQVERIQQFKSSSFTDPKYFVDFLNRGKTRGSVDFVSFASFMHCLKTHKEELGVEVDESNKSGGLLSVLSHSEDDKDTFNDHPLEGSSLASLVRVRAIDSFINGSYKSIKNFIDIYNVGKKSTDPEFVPYRTFWTWWDTERNRQDRRVKQYNESSFRDPKSFVNSLNEGVVIGSDDYTSYISFMYCLERPDDKISKNLMELFSSRCKTCFLCRKDDCSKCEPCIRNRHRSENISKEVCLRKMCCQIELEEKEQSAAGFPPGWRFVFDKPKQKMVFQTIEDHRELDGLLLLAPNGRRYYSIENACRHNPTKLRDVEGITKEFYKLVGEPMQRKDSHHVLLGKGICENWTDVKGDNKVVHGVITDCKIQEDASEPQVYFIVTYNENSRSLANRCGAAVPVTRKIKAALAWGGYLMLHEKLKTPEKELISQRPQCHKWIVPDMRHETQERTENGNWLPQLTLALRNYHLIFTVKKSTIPNAGMGVFVRAVQGGAEENEESSTFVLESGELLDIGIYAPFCISDKKEEHVFFVKNFVHSMKAEEWAFDTIESDTMFDITDDCTGDIHDLARTHIPAYINECGRRYEPSIRAEHDPEGNVHYLFGHVASKLSIPTDGEEIELFIDYGPEYENVRLRKGYSELSTEEKAKRLKELQQEDADYLGEIETFSGENIIDCIRFFVDLFLSGKQGEKRKISELVRQRSAIVIERLRERAQDILDFKEESNMVDSVKDSIVRAEQLLNKLKETNCTIEIKKQ